MGEAVPMDLIISDLQISGISDKELEVAFNRVLVEHKDAVASINQSMKDADDAYRKYLDGDYEPIEEEAKKDRANLNKAEKNIAEKFNSLKSAYERPLEQIEMNIKEIRKAIQSASNVVDSKVKAHEEKQRTKKWEEIETYWKAKNFDLVPLTKIFDQKWLNKGTKMKDIREKIDEDIAGIYRDIEVLERIAEYGQTAKAMYLENLDMSAALRQVDILKENAERLAREQANREERKIKEQMEQQTSNESKERREEAKAERIKGLVDQSLGLPEGTTAAQDKVEVIECTLQFSGTKEQLLKLKEYMTAQRISYKKILFFRDKHDATRYSQVRKIQGEIQETVYLKVEAIA